ANQTQRIIVVGPTLHSARGWLAAVGSLPATSHHDFTKPIVKSRAATFKSRPNPSALLGMFLALTQLGERIMHRTVATVSFVLVFAFAFAVTAQETTSPDDTIANLKQQLMEIEWSETESRIRLE